MKMVWSINLIMECSCNTNLVHVVFCVTSFVMLHLHEQALPKLVRHDFRTQKQHLEPPAHAHWFVHCLQQWTSLPKNFSWCQAPLLMWSGVYCFVWFWRTKRLGKWPLWIWNQCQVTLDSTLGTTTTLCCFLKQEPPSSPLLPPHL